MSDGAPCQKPDIVQQRRVFIAQGHSIKDVFGFLQVIGALRLQHCQADCHVPDGPSERYAFLHGLFERCDKRRDIVALQAFEPQYLSVKGILLEMLAGAPGKRAQRCKIAGQLQECSQIRPRFVEEGQPLHEQQMIVGDLERFIGVKNWQHILERFLRAIPEVGETRLHQRISGRNAREWTGVECRQHICNPPDSLVLLTQRKSDASRSRRSGASLLEALQRLCVVAATKSGDTPRIMPGFTFAAA